MALEEKEDIKKKRWDTGDGYDTVLDGAGGQTKKWDIPRWVVQSLSLGLDGLDSKNLSRYALHKFCLGEKYFPYDIIHYT